MVGTVDDKNEMIMKLLHYFITEQNYNPVILQGADNEIWLENLESDYKIIRLVSNHIHNNEQLEFDTFKTRRVVRKIKRKTVTFNIKVLTIFTDLGSNVELKEEKDIDSAFVTCEDDVKKFKFIKEAFPDINKKLKFTEEGMKLYIKITADINRKNKEEADKTNGVFKMKVPYVTYTLIAINILVFMMQWIIINPNITSTYCVWNEGVIRYHEYYRLVTGMFLHADIMHIAFNMYALYIIGRQLESYIGRTRFLIVYIVSGIFGSMLSVALHVDSFAAVGASGAIFGLMGALVYFGYHYRLYLGNVVLSQIAPIIILNLALGFAVSGIDNWAHIGGLIGGILSTMIVGIEGKSDKTDRINGSIVTVIIIGLLLFVIFNPR